MVHEDAIPFLIHAALAISAGVLGKQEGRTLALALFCAGGLFPLLAYVSNGLRLPIPSAFELFGFFTSTPLLLLGSWCVGRHQTGWSIRMVGFWVIAAAALCAAILLSLMIVGIGRIPA